MIFLAGLVIGAIVGLATGSGWALVVALLVDACATAIVAFGAILLATEVEHVSPSRAARLEREGVRDPDEKLTELVQQYAGARRPAAARATADGRPWVPVAAIVAVVLALNLAVLGARIWARHHL